MIFTKLKPFLCNNVCVIFIKLKVKHVNEKLLTVMQTLLNPVKDSSNNYIIEIPKVFLYLT